MATPLTSWRVARDNLTDFTNSVPETREMDFDMSVNGGIEIAMVDFSVEVEVDTQTTAPEEGAIELTLQIENDNLETPFLEQTVNVFVDDSEIVADAIYALSFHEDSVNGHAAYNLMKTSESRWVYKDIIGSHLIIATNPSFRGTVEGDLAGNVTVNGFIQMWYRHVRLSDKEILENFFQRR